MHFYDGNVLYMTLYKVRISKKCF